MTNIQIKAQIENNDTKVDAVYRFQRVEEFFIDGKFSGNAGGRHCWVNIDNFYVNLDIISSFRFDKLDRNIDIYIDKGSTEYKTTLEAGTNFITFYVFSESLEIVYLVLAFPHFGEFERFKRILTDKLCVK